jgi:hypothetical protein
MLTVEIRVNGSIVSALDAVNIGGIGECQYRYRVVRFPVEHKQPLRTASGTISHKREDGIEVLVTKILTAAVV